MKQQHMIPENLLHAPSPLFAQLLREKPERALAWLRAADYMPDDQERRYCLEQALLIDASDTTAQSLLLALNQPCSEHERPWLSKGRCALGHLLQAIFTTTVLYRNPSRGTANETTTCLKQTKGDQRCSSSRMMT